MKLCISTTTGNGFLYDIMIYSDHISLSNVNRIIHLYIIKNYENNVYECQINDEKYLIYKITDNIFNCISLVKQHLSGELKCISSKFEYPGFLLDKKTKTAWFRIGKNGSSCLIKAYSFNNVLFSKEQLDNYKTIYEITPESLKYMTKYSVVRNPEYRIKSQINHLMISSWDYDRIYRKYIFSNLKNTTQFLLKKLYNIENAL